MATGGQFRRKAFARWPRTDYIGVSQAPERSPMTADDTPWPTEIRLNPAKDTLRVAFDDGDAYDFSAEFLRVHSPSAEIKGHGNEERKIIGGKRAVTISAVEPTGNYAVRLTFSDGHNTGIFSWSYLIEVGRDMDRLWRQYLRDLEKRNLKRD
jgi:DUF971 family protein